MTPATKKTLAALLISGSLIGTHLGTGYLADRHDLNDRLIYPIVHNNKQAAEGFTDEPFDLTKKIIINEKNQIETYFGSRRTNEYLPVKPDNTVGSPFRYLYECVKDFFLELFD